MTTGISLFSSLSFLLGVVVTSTLSSLLKSDSENTVPLIKPDQHSYCLPWVEKIVDSRFKLLAANFQDQIDDLKGKVIILEGRKTFPKDQDQHEIQKRQASGKKSSRLVCENSSSFCTYFHPDHPDAGRKRGNYTATISTNEKVQEPGKVKGIPTSCEDLQLLGHKLNGVFLIKTSQPDQGMKLEAVFCDFQSSANVSASQNLIGRVKITTKNVFFYVQRNSPFSSVNAIIPFELERLNEGGAFNLASGVFTAPVPGIYHFEFHGVKDQSISYMDIILQLNGNTFASITTGVSVTMETMSLSATLRLKAGDQLNMYNWKNNFPFPTGALHDVDYLHLTHFSGWLLEEDLI